MNHVKLAQGVGLAALAVVGLLCPIAQADLLTDAYTRTTLNGNFPTSIAGQAGDVAPVQYVAFGNNQVASGEAIVSDQLQIYAKGNTTHGLRLDHDFSGMDIVTAGVFTVSYDYNSQIGTAGSPNRGLSLLVGGDTTTLGGSTVFVSGKVPLTLRTSNTALVVSRNVGGATEVYDYNSIDPSIPSSGIRSLKTRIQTSDFAAGQPATFQVWINGFEVDLGVNNGFNWANAGGENYIGFEAWDRPNNGTTLLDGVIIDNLVVAIPEPASLMLLGCGVGLILARPRVR